MNRSPFAVLLLGAGLLATGFFVGYGFQSRASQSALLHPAPPPAHDQAPSPPLVNGLHSSPDGTLLAWTGVWDRDSRAGVWVFDMKSRRAHLSPSPLGWEDFVWQWRADGRALLVERKKIPRNAVDATSGLFQTPIDRATLSPGEPRSVMPPLPSGEKLVSGTFAPDGTLLLKTRREPKSLFLASNGATRLLDRAAQSYGQNRALKQNGKLVVYAVREASQSAGVALFRIENGRAAALTKPLQDVAWSYVSPSARYFVVAREDPESGDYIWTLYEIGAKNARELRSQSVPADAMSAYWSPDENQIVSAGGKKLWSVSVPELKVRQIGDKSDWNADDATWIGTQNAIALAANGAFWRVDVASGKAQQMWKFPSQFFD